VLFRSENGAMDTLLDVNELESPARASTQIGGPFTTITVSYVNQNGDGSVFLSQGLAPSDEITIATNNSHKVIFALDASWNASISVIGLNGAIPLVEAKQSKGKRRYVVINAGAIKTVSRTKGAFLSAMDADTLGSIYTSVAFLPGDDGAPAAKA